QTQCIINCIGKIRMAGWIHQPANVDPESPVDFMVHVRKVALPLYPQFGLMMNVYYIPPVHVPLPYLQQMFGPGVPRALETYRNVKDDEQLLGLFLLMGATDRWIDRFRVKDGQAFAYDSKGAEIVRVPIKEPTYVRPLFDQVRGVYRHNIT
ncbi:MAG: dehydrogenase, partial [Chloroflexi bacterium]|nr:dehydrogenase [Chloroflexota bacterium]